jgi:hypothetical protein
MEIVVLPVRMALLIYAIRSNVYAPVQPVEESCPGADNRKDVVPNSSTGRISQKSDLPYAALSQLAISIVATKFDVNSHQAHFLGPSSYDF